MSMIHQIGGSEITLRPPDADDAAAIATFAAAMPPHDLLFLARDIRQPKVVSAWLDAQERGQINSSIALVDGAIVGTVAIFADPLSWSPHVLDIRLLVAPAWRGKGLGRKLLDLAVNDAILRGATKVTARMTPDQAGAITLFEECGFRAEAMLHGQLRDAAGGLHDLAVLALDPARAAARREAFGD